MEFPRVLRSTEVTTDESGNHEETKYYMRPQDIMFNPNEPICPDCGPSGTKCAVCGILTCQRCAVLICDYGVIVCDCVNAGENLHSEDLTSAENFIAGEITRARITACLEHTRFSSGEAARIPLLSGTLQQYIQRFGRRADPIRPQDPQPASSLASPTLTTEAPVPIARSSQPPIICPDHPNEWPRRVADVDIASSHEEWVCSACNRRLSDDAGWFV